MKKPLLFFVFLIFVSFAHGEGQIPPSPLRPRPESRVFELPRIRFPWELEAVQEELLPEAPPPEPLFAVIPSRVRPGDPVTVASSGVLSGAGETGLLRAVILDTRGRRLSRAVFTAFTQTNEGEEVSVAILALPSTAGSGFFTIRIEDDEEVFMELPLEAESRDFYSETIALDARNTAIRTEPDPQRTRESEILWGILSRSGSDFFDGGPFVPPVTSTRRTSSFGSRRVYEYVTGTTDTAIHAGVDYGVPTGTEVTACAGGRVVFSRHRIVTGFTVILEHLPGVYSLYYHLDELIAEEGTIMGSGELLGYSGSTGLSTGPHLHWEIRVSGENTDPDILLYRAILDKNEILSNLRTY